MISRYSEWPRLTEALRASFPPLAGVPDSVAIPVLAGPCAVARWIAERAPQLAERGSLSLLIVGAETVDVPDEARWYQLVPLLLERTFSIQVTLVGLELDAGFKSSVADRAPARAAATYRTSLAAFLAEGARAPIDLTVVFHPGLQKHRGWLARDGFPLLLERGIPVVCAAYEVDEYEMERWVVEAYGYQASTTPLLNPLYLDLSDEKTAIHWGRAMWEIEAAPRSDAAPDQARLAMLDTLNRMVLHSMVLNVAAPACGALVELRSDSAGARTLAHVFDNRYLEPATGELMLLDQGRLVSLKRWSPESWAAYPGNDARDIDRAIWAAAIKERQLLDTYPAAAGVDSSGLAADMLASLRRKAAALFGRGR